MVENCLLLRIKYNFFNKEENDMKIITTKSELIRRQGDGYFNNELASIIGSMKKENSKFDEIVLTGFEIKDIKEVLEIIEGSAINGEISFKSNGDIVYKFTLNKLSVILKRKNNE